MEVPSTNREKQRINRREQGPFIASEPKGKMLRQHIRFTRAHGPIKAVSRVLKQPRNRVIKLFQDSIAKRSRDTLDEQENIYGEKFLATAREAAGAARRSNLDNTLGFTKTGFRMSEEAREVAMEAFLSYIHEVYSKSVLLAGISRRRVVMPEHVRTVRLLMDGNTPWQGLNFAAKACRRNVNE